MLPLRPLYLGLHPRPFGHRKCKSSISFCGWCSGCVSSCNLNSVTGGWPSRDARIHRNLQHPNGHDLGRVLTFTSLTQSVGTLLGAHFGSKTFVPVVFAFEWVVLSAVLLRTLSQLASVRCLEEVPRIVVSLQHPRC
eukprot:2326372-Amphidinium_carterae.1